MTDIITFTVSCKHHRMANNCVYTEKNFLTRCITCLKEFEKFLQKTVECRNDLIHERFVLSEIISSILLWHTLPRIQFLSFSYFDHLLMPNVSQDRYILIVI